MAIINRIGDFHDDMTAWRRDLHAHPELGFEEVRTSAFVAEKLRSFGLDEVHTGLARTGVVGVLRAGSGRDAIGLRADMDALPIEEATGRPYASTVPGKMHACGHDGHTTMLLGAARYLAETRNFDGTVYFIFQPAEEMQGGGRVMVEEGLFERFAAARVFGMHNWPRMPLGTFAMRAGPIMAAADRVEIRLIGQGGHGAMPHLCRDPVVAGAQIVTALQTVVARNVDPVAQGVVSITQFHGGDADNVIPQEVTLRGTIRSFAPEVRDLLERRVGEIARVVAQAHEVRADVTYTRGYPATINSEAETAQAAAAAADVVGEDRVDRAAPPVMGAEDFAYMLEQRPGAYVFMGVGGDESAPTLHSPDYDFNDEALPYGASYWARLVEQLLPAR
ncbi:MAG TPA: M20 aminoacylase family protein [Geminicoccaceae bacterium]|nr:M20 aminoacylase family protein [Geminicoccaceae bacterium]